MTAPIRLAIVGLGKIATDQHVPVITRSPKFKLVATVSRHADPLASIPAFQSIEDLIETGMAIDAVAICTPPQVRHDIAQAALAQGWHCFLEKPPGATLSEVIALRDMAREKNCTLFASWHSQFADGIAPARAWLQDKVIKAVRVTWREDVRVWHPGQTWIWQPGGFGVFDPGINALSILTKILPNPLLVTKSELLVPANLHAPIAALLTMRDRTGMVVQADFDFRQEGPQHWDIEIDTDGGPLKLANGGATLSIDSREMSDSNTETNGEYAGLYRRFAELVVAGQSDVDVAPLRIVADAFLCGRFEKVDAFHE